MQNVQSTAAYTGEGSLPTIGLREVEVLPGISLHLLDVVPQEDVVVKVAPERERIEFAFVLNGEAESTLSVRSREHLFHAEPGVYTALYLPGSQGSFSLRRQEHVKMFGLNLETGRLKRLLGFDEAVSISRIMRINTCAPLSPPMRVLASQFFSSSKSGIAYSLFLQGKAMELLAELIESIAGDTGRAKGQERGERSVSLTSRDVRSMRRAREILAENMASPPRLAELCSLVGLSINKLKAGFHVVYDKTPYQCLHEDRMEKARQLLSTGDMNVSEVAWDVGYANTGHFSSAFSQYFGVKPKALQLHYTRKGRLP